MSTAQWYDPFRDTGRPSLYSGSNRLGAVYDDVLNILIYIFFSTLLVAFLVILPGIRKEVSVLRYRRRPSKSACNRKLVAFTLQDTSRPKPLTIEIAI